MQRHAARLAGQDHRPGGFEGADRARSLGQRRGDRPQARQFVRRHRILDHQTIVPGAEMPLFLRQHPMPGPHGGRRSARALLAFPGQVQAVQRRLDVGQHRHTAPALPRRSGRRGMIRWPR